MATLLQIGRRVINLDLIFEIEDYGDRMRVFYTVTASDSSGAYADFSGPEADALRRWLAENAAQLLPRDDAQPQYDEPPAGDRAQLPLAGAAPDAPPADSAFYGVDRMRQMRGAGDSDPGPPPPGRPPQG